MLSQELHDAHVRLAKVNKELTDIIDLCEAKGKQPAHSERYYPLKVELNSAYKHYMDLLKQSKSKENEKPEPINAFDKAFNP